MLIVFDLDGVLYRGETPLPGAVDAVNLLARRGHALFFLTNNSTRSRAHYARKLERFGIPARPEQIVTSASVTARYLAERGAGERAAYVLGEEGLRQELELEGLRVLAEETDAQADYVVVGLDRQLTYAKLARAHAQVRGGAEFIASNRDAAFPVEEGRDIPGSGAVVAALACSTGQEPLSLGKPAPHAWEQVLARAQARPEEALMVGDRAETDILGAKRLGLRTVLVLTGVTPPEAVPHLPEDQRPDAVLPSAAELPGLVEQWEPAAAPATAPRLPRFHRGP